ncbi:MAG: hypothetical protein RIR12_2591 [Bacteroidota bacterium]|jgi:hypothetical protein
MTPEQIEKYIEKEERKGTPLSIHFKDRQSVTGTFVETADYDELKLKNLWRVVTPANINDWNKTKNQNLNRIFNGASFTRLSD